MIYSKFGKTDLEVSEIGFGAWAIGGKSWGDEKNDHEAIQALEKACDMGINLYDTCDAYGDGHSECLIGEFLKGRREQAVIVTKGGTNYRMPDRRKDFTRDYLMMCLDESLKRLQTEYIDVYLLHVPDVGWQDREKVFDTLKEMKESGKVRYTGLAMWGAEDTMHALAMDTKDTLDVLECPFNILNKSNVQVVELAKQREIAVLTSQPLASGVLTGKYKTGTVFGNGDNRQGFWTKERWEALAPDMEIIESCAEETGLSMTELALAYNLSYEGISCVIPGGRNPRQVEGNVRATGKRLDRAVMERLMQTKGFTY